MPGPWKAWKTKDRFPTFSTVPWESRRKREIPTFPPPGFAAMEKWKTNSRFPTFPPPLATITPVLSLKTKKPRKDVGRYAASSFPICSPCGRTEPISCSSFDWKMLRSSDTKRVLSSRSCGNSFQNRLMSGNLIVRFGLDRGRSSATGWPCRSMTMTVPSAASRTSSEVRMWRSRMDAFLICYIVAKSYASAGTSETQM